MCRTAVNNDCLTEPLVALNAMIGYESIPLHHIFFPKFWLDVHDMNVSIFNKFIHLIYSVILIAIYFYLKGPNLPFLRLLSKNNYFVDYLESTLIEERLSLNNDVIYNFVKMFFPEVIITYTFLVLP